MADKAIVGTRLEFEGSRHFGGNVCIWSEQQSRCDCCGEHRNGLMVTVNHAYGGFVCWKCLDSLGRTG